MSITNFNDKFDLAYTKDMAKWEKFYQGQTVAYAYEPFMPNRPMGTTIVPEPEVPPTPPEETKKAKASK